mgnify:CR=1 FL=1
MATPVHHAMSSAKKHGGTWEQYIHIHDWFDATKAWIPDSRHRAMRHHAEGIFECEKVFGHAVKITLSNGVVKEVDKSIGNPILYRMRVSLTTVQSPEEISKQTNLHVEDVREIGRAHV